nr:ribonuclease H-like domain-containing protein [Tanacetum cinerariifolium]
HLGKFDGKANVGFFVGYSLNRKAFRVFNSRTKIVEETLHIRFSENTPNNLGSRPNWLLNIDALTKIMNYQPVVAGTQSNSNASIKDNNNVGQARKEKEPGKDYILLPLWAANPPFPLESKSSQDAGFKPSNDVKKKVNEVPRQENECNDQKEKDSVNNTNRVNAVSSTINAASNKLNVVSRKSSIELLDDPNMPELEDISIFEDSNEDVFGFEDPDFPDKVYKVEKALYGLHNAPRAWHKSDILLVQVYVDDIIFGSTKKEL